MSIRRLLVSTNYLFSRILKMPSIFDGSESSLANSSLSGTPGPKIMPRTLSSFPKQVEHAPQASKIKAIARVRKVAIKIGGDGSVPGFLHVPQRFEHDSSPPFHGTAAILLSGAGGGVTGPSGIYLSLADKLASLPHLSIPVLRMDYRYPARNQYCTQDVLSAMDYLHTTLPSINRFVLVGWSFGSAPVFTVASQALGRIAGCAVVAPQTAETGGITSLSPKPMLLLHGTGDRTLSYICSKRLYEAYGNKGQREVRFFEGDDHALTRNAGEAERLIGEFVVRCAGLKVDALEDGEKEVLQETLAGRPVEMMKLGGDLDGQERVE